jgi:Na+:H+ antiporter, NhaA family
VLLVATVLALVLANSPLQDGFESLWKSSPASSLGSLDLPHDLRHWINDGLMAVFFFVVGLEIKREITTGELKDPRTRNLPVVAAIGGMAVPALLYALVNVGGEGAAGWGVPVATDIALAVGIIALLGNRVPTGARIFLLTLAVADDIGAILVVALFYPSDIDVMWLISASVLGAAVIVVTRVASSKVLFAALGCVLWFATFQSGVHAAVAGVALGLIAPRHLMGRAEDILHPWTSHIVIPLFALANAGIVLSGERIDDALTSPITLGVVLGLVVGKALGISLFSWVAVRSGIGRLPGDVGPRSLVGLGFVAGIGFTVSIFIAGLAFPDDARLELAKLGVLLGSVLAAIVGTMLLRRGERTPP